MISSVYLEITNLCNLKCRYCYNGGDHSKPVELSIIEILKVVAYCKKRSVDIIISGGEPFLYTQINSLLEIIKYNKNVLFHIVTNGTRVPFKEIQSLDNLRLHISLDSADESINSLSRGSYNSRDVYNLIYKLGNSNVPFYVNMVITKLNIGGIKDFYEMVVANNGIPQFNFVQYQSSAIDNWRELGLNDFQKIKCLKTISDLNNNGSTKSNQLGCFNMCPLTIKGTKIGIAINSLGEIYPCQLLRCEDLKLGNIKDLSKLDTIYTNILMMQEKLQLKKTMDYGCQKCYLNDMCYRGCLAEAFIKHNNYYASDDNCDIRRWQYLYKLGEQKK